jgi:hypothetical protein
MCCTVPPTVIPVTDLDAPGSGDCEARVETWGQPVLFTSSASYVVAALVVLWWARRHNSAAVPVPRAQAWLFAAGLVAAGLGSMDYHGPALGPEPLLHDGGLVIALVAALSIDLTQLGVWRPARSWGLLGLTLAAFVVIILAPQLSPALAAVAAIGLVAAELAVYRRGIRTPGPPLYAGLGCLLVGGVVFSLSRTGGPLCDPESLLQGHAVWHVLTAAALALWAVTALPDRKESR